MQIFINNVNRTDSRFVAGLPSGRAQETVKWQKKRNFIPKQNTHDLLVGTLSIDIPSFIVKMYILRKRLSKLGYYGNVRCDARPMSPDKF